MGAAGRGRARTGGSGSGSSQCAPLRGHGARSAGSVARTAPHERHGGARAGGHAPSAYGYMAPKESSEAPNMQWKYGSTLPGLICGTSTPRAVGNAERAQPQQNNGWGGARRWRSSCQSWRRASRCTWPGSSPSGPAAERPGSDVSRWAKCAAPNRREKAEHRKRESRPVRAPRPPPSLTAQHRLTCPSLENVRSLRRIDAKDAISAPRQPPAKGAAHEFSRGPAEKRSAVWVDWARRCATQGVGKQARQTVASGNSSFFEVGNAPTQGYGAKTAASARKGLRESEKGKSSSSTESRSGGSG